MSATWIADEPTTLPAALTSTVCPACTRPSATVMCQAVPKPTKPAAAVSKGRASGSGITESACETQYSACVPHWPAPMRPCEKSTPSRPLSQGSESGSPCAKSMATRVPGAGPSTPGPSAAISPTPSQPGTCGSVTGMPETPSRTSWSRWLMPLARMRTRTSPGPGSGVSISS